MRKTIKLWKFHDDKLKWNPLEDSSYLELLWIFPTLKSEIEKKIKNLLNFDYKEIDINKIYDNSGIISKEKLEKYKLDLISELTELAELLWNNKNIIIFSDKCFTNILLIDIIKNILWEENFDKFIDLREIDLSQKYDQSNFNFNETNNKLILFWWSLNDTYTIESSYYKSRFAKLIKMIWDDCDPFYMNYRIIWICFWQQFIANLLWIKNSYTSSVTVTYKWPAEFWPSNCKIQIKDGLDN